MKRELTVMCGAENVDGARLASVTCDGWEYVALARVTEAYERVCFVARALRHFGIELSSERLAELELQLVRAVREVDKRPAFADEPQIVRLSNFKAEPLNWLWPGRIARGAITLLAGDPGLGKSMVTLDIAARVSRGGDWPDGERGLGRPGSVVLLSGEDDLETTILPRLKTMGADTRELVTIEPRRDGWSGEEPPPFELDRDMDELRRTVERLGNCALVVLDPVSAFLGRTGECSNADVRRLFMPLAELARRKRLAVLMVSHLRKDMGVAVRQTLGSMAFVAVSRMAWLVSRDAEDFERRLMLPVKNNLAAEVDGLAFTVGPLSGKPVSGELESRQQAVVKWSAERIRVRTDEVLSASRRPAGRPDAERREAMEWLREYLSKGPQGATEVREAGEAQGFTFSTLRRAFRALGGVAVKGQDGWRDGWQWKLPGCERREECKEVANEEEAIAAKLEAACAGAGELDKELEKLLAEAAV